MGIKNAELMLISNLMDETVAKEFLQKVISVGVGIMWSFIL
jgi:hypothetical protein